MKIESKNPNEITWAKIELFFSRNNIPGILLKVIIKIVELY